MNYFSERETGEPPRETKEIPANVWKGLLSLIRNRAADNSFGAQYPEFCQDGTWVYGADMRMFEDAMRAEIPNLATIPEKDFSGRWQSTLKELGGLDKQPSTLDILDLIEFCWKSIGKPKVLREHSYFRHNHLEFDERIGREEFRGQVETIFRRNGIGYVLNEEGRVDRLAPPVFQNALVQHEPDTGDRELDRLLGTAQRKFLDPNPEIRREALEALWDAWERLKTLDGQGDKKAQAEAMLDKAAGNSSPKFREALGREAREITDIGNNLRIRHSETNQEILATADHVDYLFYRLFSLMELNLGSG